MDITKCERCFIDFITNVPFDLRKPKDNLCTKCSKELEKINTNPNIIVPCKVDPKNIVEFYMNNKSIDLRKIELEKSLKLKFYEHYKFNNSPYGNNN